MFGFLKKHAFLLCLISLIALRFLHFGPEIDWPHDWRQCDTGWFIWDFYKNGIDLLHPAVCWMGAADLTDWLSGLKPIRIIGLKTRILNLYHFRLPDGVPEGADKGLQFVP